MSTMYFYKTAYRQYVHSGSDTRIHYWLTSGESILPPSSHRPLAVGLFPSLFFWTSFSFFDSLDGACRSRLTLLESECCPTSFPTVHPKVPYK